MAEMNRDESNRCIQIAQRSFDAGDVEKAIRFLEKSIKLCPNTRAQDLLEEIQSARNGESAKEPEGVDVDNETAPGRSRQSPSRDSASRDRSKSGARQRKKPSHTKSDFQESRPGSDTRKDYTDEQHQAVLRVKKCTTFYQVLQIEKDGFSEAILKKQYRKLALVLHPDKNVAPGAGEAFKIVGKAYAVLSNSQKKAEYDAGGDNYEAANYNPQYARQQTRRRYYRSGNFMFFEDDVSADDIFNMFFGQGFNRYDQDEEDSPRTRQHQRGNSQQEQRHSSGFTLLLQLSPLLLFLGLSALSSLTYTEPVYSLHYSAKYPTAAATRTLEVRYYLKSDLGTVTAKDMERIEQNVEELYLNNLRDSCMRERNYKENVMWRGRLYGDAKLMQKGRELETPACDNMSRAYQKLAAAA